MKTATLPYHCHICTSRLLAPSRPLKLLPPSSAVFNNKRRLGQRSQADMYAPAWPAGTGMDLILSSAPAVLWASPPSTGARGSRAHPSPTAHPSQAGRAGVQAGAHIGAACAPQEGCLSRLMLCRSWLSLSQPSCQLSEGLKASSPTSFHFTIIFQRNG